MKPLDPAVDVHDEVSRSSSLVQSVSWLPGTGWAGVRFPTEDETDLWLVIRSMAGTSLESAPVRGFLPLGHHTCAPPHHTAITVILTD